MIEEVLSMLSKRVVEKNKTKFILDVTEESYSVYSVLSDAKMLFFLYIGLYIFFWLSLLFFIPGATFYFLNFGLSVLVFFIGLFIGIRTTYKIVKMLPKMLYNDVIERATKIKTSYHENYKNSDE